MGLVLVLWCIGFVALALTWFTTRPRTHLRPACGTGAGWGETACRRCGRDLSAAALLARDEGFGMSRRAP